MLKSISLEEETPIFSTRKTASSPGTGFNSRISLVLGSKNGMDAKGCSSCSVALIFKERHQNKSGKKETCVSQPQPQRNIYFFIT